ALRAVLERTQRSRRVLGTVPGTRLRGGDDHGGIPFRRTSSRGHVPDQRHSDEPTHSEQRTSAPEGQIRHRLRVAQRNAISTDAGITGVTAVGSTPGIATGTSCTVTLSSVSRFDLDRPRSVSVRSTIVEGSALWWSAPPPLPWWRKATVVTKCASVSGTSR